MSLQVIEDNRRKYLDVLYKISEDFLLKKLNNGNDFDKDEIIQSSNKELHFKENSIEKIAETSHSESSYYLVLRENKLPENSLVEDKINTTKDNHDLEINKFDGKRKSVSSKETKPQKKFSQKSKYAFRLMYIFLKIMKNL